MGRRILVLKRKQKQLLILCLHCTVNAALKNVENEIAYCGIATDGGNHNSIKIFPVIIQYFDWKNGGLQWKLIELKNTTNETRDTITNYVKEDLEKKCFLKKCTSFKGALHCLKNAGVMKMAIKYLQIRRKYFKRDH